MSFWANIRVRIPRAGVRIAFFSLTFLAVGASLARALGLTSTDVRKFWADRVAHMRELDALIAGDHAKYADLNDKDRLAVVVWWGRKHDATAQWGLLKAANDPDPRIRQEALFNLGRRCDAKDDASLAALLDRGQSDSGLIEIMGDCRIKEGAPALLRLLDGPAASVAATALGKIGEVEAVPRLKKSLASQDAWVAISAADALASLGDRSGYDIAAKWLSDTTGSQSIRGSVSKLDVQVVAARTLGKIGTKADLPLLRTAFERVIATTFGRAASRAIIEIMAREGMQLSDWKSNPTSRHILLGSFPEDMYGWDPRLSSASRSLASRNDDVVKIERVAGASSQDIFRYSMRDPAVRFGRHLAAIQAVMEVVLALDHQRSRKLLKELLSESSTDPEIVSLAKNRLQLIDKWETEGRAHAALWQ
jgi:hypothetical protein